MCIESSKMSSWVNDTPLLEFQMLTYTNNYVTIEWFLFHHKKIIPALVYHNFIKNFSFLAIKCHSHKMFLLE